MKKKYYLVFYSDNGNREDCNVYYSWLTRAETKRAAIKRVAEREGLDIDALDADKMNLV